MNKPHLLWTPPAWFSERSNLHLFMAWLAKAKELNFNGYHELWKWSTVKYQEFWPALLEYFQVKFDGSYDHVVSTEAMPGVRWFNGMKLNYAEHVFARSTPNHPAIIASNENGRLEEISWEVLQQRVASLRAYLKSIGIGKGDCVAAFLPNIPEATISFLATNSLGAIWSSCSPDFGTQAVVDRFAQIKPRVLMAIDQYAYGGKTFDKLPVIAEVVSQIPSIEKVIVLRATGSVPAEIYTNWADTQREPNATLSFERVGFNDPIWVLYSSGTTGLPKAITHSQGGVLLEQLKYLTFHKDVHPGERCFWFTTTGWMMWNHIQGCLLCGGTIVLYDGSPAYPDMNALWRLAEKARITHFGTSAGFILASIKAGTHPGSDFDLSSIVSIGSTGSTLPAEGFEWVYQKVKKDVWLTSVSGGTDVCSAFVGGNPLWPVYAGELQCRALGCSLEVWDEEGHPVGAGNGEGEMVITRPMPSMPVFLWNDPENHKYRESYFEMFPGIWRHGDWIELTERLGVVIYGRSDATLNRDGVRIGTSEIYRAVEKVPEVKDSLIVCVERPGGKFYMPLFVMLQPGYTLTDELKKKINALLRSEYSPRHVPDVILTVADIPYTISGKKTETPVKKILLGRDPSKVVSLGSLRNPESLQFFIQHYESLGSQ